MAMFFILGPLTEQGKGSIGPARTPQVTTSLDKINGQPRPPTPPPPAPNKVWENGAFLPFVQLHP